MVDSPHPIAQKRLFQSYLSHNSLVFFVKVNFFLEVFGCVFTDINDHIEVFPKVKVVLYNIEDLLLLRVSAVLDREEVSKLTIKIIWVILIAGTCVP